MEIVDDTKETIVKDEKYRIFLGGLDPNAAISEQDVKSRFDSFFKVEKVKVVRDKKTGLLKGFAYIDVIGDSAALKKCIKIYSGSQWKGSCLRLEVAKPSILDKLKLQRQNHLEVKEEHCLEKGLEKNSGDPNQKSNANSKGSANETENKKEKGKKSGGKWKFISLAEDMTIITQKNSKNKKYWKRLASGKPVRIMRVRLPGTRRVSVIDPAKFPEKFKKFKLYDTSNDVAKEMDIRGCPSASVPFGRLDHEDFDSDSVNGDSRKDGGSDEEDGEKIRKLRDERLGKELLMEKQTFMDVYASIFGKDQSAHEDTEIHENQEADKISETEHYGGNDKNEQVERENLFMKTLFNYNDNKNVEKEEPKFSFSFVKEDPRDSEISSQKSTLNTTSNPGQVTEKEDRFTRDKLEKLPFIFSTSSRSIIYSLDSLIDVNASFKRPSIEESTEFWNKTKEILTMEYKKRSKNAVRISNKMEQITPISHQNYK